jgi:hypothetical protein
MNEASKPIQITTQFEESSRIRSPQTLEPDPQLAVVFIGLPKAEGTGRCQ